MDGGSAMTRSSAAVSVDATSTVTYPRWSFLRWVSGILAVGQVVLLLIVLSAKIVSWMQGYPGQSWWELGWHTMAAALVVALQRVADHRRGTASWLASSAVILIVAATLWLFWWS